MPKKGGPENGRPARGRLALWLALGGLLATFLGTFGAFVGFALLSAGFITGIRALREAKSSGDPTIAAGATPAIVIGSVGLFLGVVGLVALILFRAEVTRFDECSLGANTEVARQACMDQLIDGVEARVKR